MTAWPVLLWLWLLVLIAFRGLVRFRLAVTFSFDRDPAAWSSDGDKQRTSYWGGFVNLQVLFVVAVLPVRRADNFLFLIMFFRFLSKPHAITLTLWNVIHAKKLFKKHYRSLCWFCSDNLTLYHTFLLDNSSDQWQLQNAEINILYLHAFEKVSFWITLNHIWLNIIYICKKKKKNEPDSWFIFLNLQDSHYSHTDHFFFLFFFRLNQLL